MKLNRPLPASVHGRHPRDGRAASSQRTGKIRAGKTKWLADRGCPMDFNPCSTLRDRRRNYVQGPHPRTMDRGSNDEEAGGRGRAGYKILAEHHQSSKEQTTFWRAIEKAYERMKRRRQGARC